MEHGLKAAAVNICKAAWFPINIPCSQPHPQRVSYPVLELMMEQERMNENVGSLSVPSSKLISFRAFYRQQISS